MVKGDSPGACRPGRFGQRCRVLRSPWYWFSSRKPRVQRAT